MDSTSLFLTIVILVLWFAVSMVGEAIFRWFVFQTKEYRADRIRDYFRSAEAHKSVLGKKNTIRFVLLIESIIHASLIGISVLSFKTFDRSVGIIALWFFWEALMFLLKLVKGRVRAPRMTVRMLMVYVLFTVLCVGFVTIFWKGFVLLFPFLMMLLMVPVFLWAALILLKPFVRLMHRRTYRKAKRRLDTYRKGSTIVGIAGSFGKSSVKNYLAALLGTEKSVLATPANTNTELGVSHFLLKSLNQTYEEMVIEMGTYARGEISFWGGIIQQQHAFVTWLNNQHSALFGGIEQAILAETEIAEQVAKHGGRMYVNRDNEYIRAHVFPADVKLIKYGGIWDADAQVTITHQSPKGTAFTFSYQGKKIQFSTDLFGQHQIINLAGAIAYALDEGVSETSIASALPDLKDVQKTSHLTQQWNLTLIDDTYNINYDGVKAGVQSIAVFDEAEKIVVLDEIIELGEDAASTHQELWAWLAKQHISHYYLVWKEWSTTLAQSLEAHGYTHFSLTTPATRQHLISTLKHTKKKTVVLLLGKGSHFVLDEL